MNKGLTFLTLLASTQATQPLARDNQSATEWYKTFPQYADNAVASVAVQLVTDIVKLSFNASSVKLGGYGCVRKGYTFDFPQTKTGAADNTPNTASSTVTFYGADSAGATQGVLTTAAIAGDGSECAPGVTQGDAAGAGSDVGKTIVIGVATSAGVIKTGVMFYSGPVGFGVDYTNITNTMKTQIEWNNDFLLASVWQKGAMSAVAEVATDYCTINYAALTDTTDATKVISKVQSAGFSGAQKCSFMIESSAAKGAPQVKLTKAQTVKFQMQWAEWESGVLTAGTDTVATTTATPLFLGSPIKAWPNPVRSYFFNNVLAHTTSVSTKLPIMDVDPLMNGYSMSPGAVAFYPDNKFNAAENETHVATQDFMQLKAAYDSYTAAANSYNSLVTTYNTDKTAYNKALADEKARKEDFFKSIFDPAVVIPTRPCQPTRPDAFSGIDFSYTQIATLTAAEKKAQKGTFNQNLGIQAVAASYKLGYMLPSNTNTGPVAAVTGAARVYGHFGYGDLQEATTVKAFQWKTAAATTTHFMMVSVLPYNYAETAFTAGQEILLQFQGMAFDDTMYAITKPSQPASTTAPDAAGAKALIASATALAAVASTLF